MVFLSRKTMAESYIFRVFLVNVVWLHWRSLWQLRVARRDDHRWWDRLFDEILDNTNHQMLHEIEYHLEDSDSGYRGKTSLDMRCYWYPFRKSCAEKWIYRCKTDRSSSQIDMILLCIHHREAKFVDRWVLYNEQRRSIYYSILPISTDSTLARFESDRNCYENPHHVVVL
jgi:hypothetical protein